MTKTTIKTASGRLVDLADFQHDDIHDQDIAHPLSMICRYGGHVPGHYSVAEHSILVSRLVEHWGFDAIVQLQALLHDAPEAYIGDMVRPLKSFMPEFREYEHQVLTVIFEREDLPIPDADSPVWHADLEMTRVVEPIIQRWQGGLWDASDAERYFQGRWDLLRYQVRYLRG